MNQAFPQLGKECCCRCGREIIDADDDSFLGLENYMGSLVTGRHVLEIFHKHYDSVPAGRAVSLGGVLATLVPGSEPLISVYYDSVTGDKLVIRRTTTTIWDRLVRQMEIMCVMQCIYTNLSQYALAWQSTGADWNNPFDAFMYVIWSVVVLFIWLKRSPWDMFHCLMFLLVGSRYILPAIGQLVFLLVKWF